MSDKDRIVELESQMKDLTHRIEALENPPRKWKCSRCKSVFQVYRDPEGNLCAECMEDIEKLYKGRKERVNS